MYVRFLSVSIVATFLAACSGQQPQQQTLSSDPQNTLLPATVADGNSGAGESSNNNDVSSSTGSTGQSSSNSVSETGGNDANGIVPGSAADFKSVAKNAINFEVNEHYISNESARILRAQARWLRKYPEKRILVEGNCDERGTREYNYALGNRRAFAARDFLISQGIPSYRIKTISYGKDKPEFLGSNETAWALNRRVVTVIVE